MHSLLARLSAFVAFPVLLSLPLSLLAAGHLADRHEDDFQTVTPIKHPVVIFDENNSDENNSFDHYFGTYPHAANPEGEPAFYPDPATPSVNGLTSTLLLCTIPTAWRRSAGLPGPFHRACSRCPTLVVAGLRERSHFRCKYSQFQSPSGHFLFGFQTARAAASRGATLAGSLVFAVSVD